MQEEKVFPMKPRSEWSVIESWNLHKNSLKVELKLTTHGYSMKKIACLDDTFSEFFKL